MEYRMPGLPVTHHLLELAQVHVHCIGDAIQPPIFSFCPWSFPASGTFPMSHLFTSDDQNTGVSASASVLPVNIQGWSPLRLTGLIFLLCKGLSGVFSSNHSLKAWILWPSAFFMVHLSQSRIESKKLLEIIIHLKMIEESIQQDHINYLIVSTYRLALCSANIYFLTLPNHLHREIRFYIPLKMR